MGFELGYSLLESALSPPVFVLELQLLPLLLLVSLLLLLLSSAVVTPVASPAMASSEPAASPVVVFSGSGILVGCLCFDFLHPTCP